MLKKLKASILFVTVCLSSLTNAAVADRQYVDMAINLLNIDNQQYLAITLKNEKKWHTYWKNPGYAGLPIKFNFFDGAVDIKTEALEWPLPKKYIEKGDMLTYGYEDTYSFFHKVNSLLTDKEITLHGTWLVCKDICIPGEKKQSFKITNNKLVTKNNFEQSNEILIKAFQALPKKSSPPKDISFFFTKISGEDSLLLQYEFNNFDPESFSEDANIIYPFLTTPLDFKKEELFFDSENKTLYGQIFMQWDGQYEDPVWNLPADGLLSRAISIKVLMPTKSGGKVFDVPFKNFQVSGYESSQKLLSSFEKLGQTKPKASSAISNKNFLSFFFLAFLGGLILNLMPCVLPVISIKLFGLIKHSGESRKKILKHNLFYSLGVLASFFVLALSVYLLKSSGEEIGWGFQMQSPYFVFSMLILLFVMSLNMLGLFEFRAPGGSKIGNFEDKGGVFDDFFNGVFATILATPCSAPFLGTALTFAFTTTTLNLFIIFLSVGFGLAFPFLLTGFFPSLISFLPRPGIWMEKLKYFLALSLLITFAWLFDVFSSLVQMDTYSMFFLLFFIFVFFAFFFMAKISKNKILHTVFFVFPILIGLYLFEQGAFNEPAALSMTSSKSSWSQWSEEQVNSSKGPIFIDFTAKWCLTCKVNKKIVLETSAFAKLAKNEGMTLMRADWTKRDPKITKFLKSYNIIGVPAYFVKSKSGELINLGETISYNEISEAINQ